MVLSGIVSGFTLRPGRSQYSENIACKRANLNCAYLELAAKNYTEQI